MQSTKIRGFTLIETLLVLVIFSILGLVLFRTYTVIIDLSVRSEIQKTMQSEVLFVNQVMHQLTDNYTIDRSKYDEVPLRTDSLVQELYMVSITDESDKAILKTIGGEEGECYSGEIENDEHISAIRQGGCALVLEIPNTDGTSTVTALTNTGAVTISHVARDLMPDDSNRDILSEGSDVYSLIAYPSIAMYGRIYSVGFGRDRATDIRETIQWFFTMRDEVQL